MWVSITSAWRDWALWCASQPCTSCVSPGETLTRAWVFQPDTLFWPDGSLNRLYSYIFFRKGISNLTVVCSNLCLLPYDHSRLRSHAPPSWDPLWVRNCSGFCCVDFSQAWLLAQIYVFWSFSSPSIVFPICQPDCY